MKEASLTGDRPPEVLHLGHYPRHDRQSRPLGRTVGPLRSGGRLPTLKTKPDETSQLEERNHGMVTRLLSVGRSDAAQSTFQSQLPKNRLFLLQLAVLDDSPKGAPGTHPHVEDILRVNN